MVTTCTQDVTLRWDRGCGDLRVSTLQDSISIEMLEVVVSPKGRFQVAERLLARLEYASAQAWVKTKGLLSGAIQRQQHQRWSIVYAQIVQDCSRLYEKTLDAYTRQGTVYPIKVVMERANAVNYSPRMAVEVCTEQLSPNCLAAIVGPDIREIRQNYVACDPRLLAFVSLQVRYVGQYLLHLLSPLESTFVGYYFKVVADCFQMPLERAYDAAANYNQAAIPLAAVRQLLSVSSAIAKSICQRFQQTNPAYRSYNGFLSDPVVQAASIRDLEVFQMYLCVCVLETNMSAVQQELFPLCAMLYPSLQVDWSLIQQTICFLDREIQMRLDPLLFNIFRPYLQALWEIFSPERLNYVTNAELKTDLSPQSLLHVQTTPIRFATRSPVYGRAANPEAQGA